MKSIICTFIFVVFYTTNCFSQEEDKGFIVAKQFMELITKKTNSNDTIEKEIIYDAVNTKKLINMIDKYKDSTIVNYLVNEVGIIVPDKRVVFSQSFCMPNDDDITGSNNIRFVLISYTNDKKLVSILFMISNYKINLGGSTIIRDSEESLITPLYKNKEVIDIMKSIQ